MKPRVFVFGTSHTLQCGNHEKYSEPTIGIFRYYIQKLITENGITIVAEEGLSESVCIWGGPLVTDTIAAMLTREIGVEHLYVDLTSAQRSALFVCDKQLENAEKRLDCTSSTGDHASSILFEELLHGIRERYWIARILSVNRWPMLFLCGSNHARSFCEILKRIGCVTEVVEMDYRLPERDPSDPYIPDWPEDVQRALDDRLRARLGNGVTI